MKKEHKRVVLVYSGGLDTTACIPLLREDYGFHEVVTVTVDVGQLPADLLQASRRAEKLRTRHYTVDAKQEFAERFIFPSILANGSYEGYPLSTSLARPLISEKAVWVAKKLGIHTLAHGCTGKGNDQFRIEFAIRQLLPDAHIIAPMREKNLTRKEEIKILKRFSIPIASSKYSIDENLWGRAIEGGELEDPEFPPPEEVYQWTRPYFSSPGKPSEISISFKNGIPVGLSGKKLAAVPLVQKLNALAGSHGVGRIDMMENRILGLKSRENYECPAAAVLLLAHKALESLVLTRSEARFKELVDAQWAELVYQGLWHDPLISALNAFIQKVSERAAGEVRVRLFKSHAAVVSRKSPYSLYSKELSSFDSKSFDQRDATGMVKVHGLQARMKKMLDKG